MKTRGGGDVRRSAAELVQSAAQLGMDEPWRITALTPAEIELKFRALSAKRQAEAEKIDMLAYLTGRYVLIAIHSPRRYPRRPDGVSHPPPKMTDNQMKQFFADLAARKGAENGDR